jgi:hypothetical protein
MKWHDQKNPADFGQLHPPRIPLEQFEAQLEFEIPHLLAERGCRHRQAAGCFSIWQQPTQRLVM